MVYLLGDRVSRHSSSVFVTSGFSLDFIISVLPPVRMLERARRFQAGTWRPTSVGRHNQAPMRRRRVILLVTLLLAAALVYAGCFSTPPGPRSIAAFDSDRTAALELEMWQAYYTKENVRLFRGLVTLLHEQNRYPWSKAARAGFHLARAAAMFGNARSDYERVLPDLERAYAIEKDWLHAGFDPAAVARAELAWWVARRVPGQNSPEQVGGLIADENALLYEVPRERVLAASILRARAGRLRDDGGDRADWATIGQLLVESYRALHAAVQPC